ncbi:hypothetical protein HMPREF9123_0846 [Neisseria bacilliformis ATCC BAA-1200]|uniref:Uncharacterized protein n=1 Tax=Neisseria bacilliformis ATCC BAA-1200 TaxID=888742 RepID=F2BAU2_9NEIS|nr:hypothetical protein HMPREF9123_0846 [Neisseria bacilliformis ATCC BAA-1200]
MAFLVTDGFRRPVWHLGRPRLCGDDVSEKRKQSFSDSLHIERGV